MRALPRTVALLAATVLNIASLTAQETTLPANANAPQTQAVTPPAWLQGAVIYEIFPRAFSSQGTLAGITERLDALRQLGVNVLWIMPISPTGKEKRLGRLGSPYSIRDYYAVDPDLGTKADLTALVQAAHQRKMRVILDMVPDHTSWDSVMMAHPNFYQHDDAGKIISPHGWSDVAGLNYGDPALRRYMDDMFLYWLKTFHVDGFRCDAAGMVPTSFWDELRLQIKRENPDALFLAEASKPELMQHAFDLDYAWPLLATFSKVLDEGAPATAIRDTLETQNAIFPQVTQHMLISDDHDEPRAVVRRLVSPSRFPGFHFCTTAWRSETRRNLVDRSYSIKLMWTGRMRLSSPTCPSSSTLLLNCAKIRLHCDTVPSCGCTTRKSSTL
jgi:cyclomaltodextrinase